MRKILTKSCTLAKHRNAERLEAKDIQNVLEKEEDVTFPIYDEPERLQKKLKRHLKNYTKKMQNIQKQMKKNLLHKDKANEGGKD
jgi:transcription initiation factor TFIID subunit TAF12